MQSLRSTAGKSVLHAHGLAHLVKGLLGDGVGAGVAVVQDVADGVHVLGELCAALAMRGEELVHGLNHVRLERAGARIADFGGNVLRVAAGHQSGGGQQRGHLRAGDGRR